MYGTGNVTISYSFVTIFCSDLVLKDQFMCDISNTFNCFFLYISLLMKKTCSTPILNFVFHAKEKAMLILLND